MSVTFSELFELYSCHNNPLMNCSICWRYLRANAVLLKMSCIAGLSSSGAHLGINVNIKMLNNKFRQKNNQNPPWPGEKITEKGNFLVSENHKLILNLLFKTSENMTKRVLKNAAILLRSVSALTSNWNTVN